MPCYEFSNLRISLNREGASRYQKVSYPVYYGQFSEIQTPAYTVRYNLNGVIKYLSGSNKHWPHPAEWLKRTLGNDWVYYFSGNYTQIFDRLGEYYLPCFPYTSNSLWQRNPFRDSQVQQALHWALNTLPDRLQRLKAECTAHPELRAFLEQVVQHRPGRLWEQGRRLFSVLKTRVRVLPPDARHVDYDVLPLILADGCSLNCGFCCVKTGQPFQVRSRQDIDQQIRGIRSLLGPDLLNYRSLFLGLHDALKADFDLLEYAARTAYAGFDFARSFLRETSLFCFASTDSFLDCPESSFERINHWPYRSYINIGLESGDQETLDQLRKPVEARKNQEAFQRSQEINQRYPNIEITSNFVLAADLPQNHWTVFEDLTRHSQKHYYPKGTVYLSPLNRLQTGRQMRIFSRMKNVSRRPTYLYLLQRL